MKANLEQNIKIITIRVIRIGTYETLIGRKFFEKEKKVTCDDDHEYCNNNDK